MLLCTWDGEASKSLLYPVPRIALFVTNLPKPVCSITHREQKGNILKETTETLEKKIIFRFPLNLSFGRIVHRLLLAVHLNSQLLFFCGQLGSVIFFNLHIDIARDFGAEQLLLCRICYAFTPDKNMWVVKVS